MRCVHCWKTYSLGLLLFSSTGFRRHGNGLKRCCNEYVGGATLWRFQCHFSCEQIPNSNKSLNSIKHFPTTTTTTTTTPFTEEDNYWDYYLKRRLVDLRENEGVEPLLTKQDDLAHEMCKQFNFREECAEHFSKYYDLYMLEYYREYVEQNGNDLSQVKMDLKTGKQKVRSLTEQQRDYSKTKQDTDEDQL